MSRKEYLHQWYLKNKGKVKKRTQKYQKTHKGKLKKYQKLYYQGNNHRILKKRKKYEMEHRKEINLQSRLRRYGLTKEQFNSMLQEQDNKCAICQHTFDENSRNMITCIDHSHKTGRVRSLLCVCCNSMIGCAADNPDILKRGMNYLLKQQD